jgi:hypothetical protein
MVAGHTAASTVKHEVLQVPVEDEARQAAELARSGTLANPSPSRAHSTADSHRADTISEPPVSEICQQIHPTSGVSSKHQGVIRARFPIDVGDYCYEERAAISRHAAPPRAARGVGSRTHVLGHVLFRLIDPSHTSTERDDRRNKTKAQSGEQRWSWYCSHSGKEQGADDRPQFGT